MHCLSFPFFKKSYDFRAKTDTELNERYHCYDELRKESENFDSNLKSKNRGNRRYAVLWEPVEHNKKSIPVFVKSLKDKDQIKYAIKRDDFLNKVIVGKRLQKVIDAMYIKEVRIKEKIVKEGSAGKHMYIISEGKFEVSKESEGVISILGANQVFGELAILYNARRQATVKALTPSKVWVLDQEIYQAIVKNYNNEEKTEKLKFLQECPILNKVELEVLNLVAELLNFELFPTGKVLVREGDLPDKFYIITAGSVAITKNTEGFKGYLYKNDCFGERAILSESPRQATVIAGENGVQCLTLAKEHFINHFGNVKDISQVSIPKTDVDLETRGFKEKYMRLKLFQFKIIQTIGEGGFARVEFIQHKKDSTLIFALKCLKRIEIVRLKLSNHVRNEKEIQMMCSSPFIVKLYKTDKDSKFLYFWLELCHGGDIYKWLQNQRKKRFDINSAKFIAACVLEALNYLHDRNIIYRDIKPENLLIDRRGYVKLADFGFAKKLKSHTKTSTFAGTPEYVAPEIIASKNYDRAVDFWSYGILIFELLHGSTPFTSDDNNHLQVYRNIEKGFQKSKIPKHFSEDAAHLVENLLRNRPEERLGYQIDGCQRIRSHSWFKEFDWEMLKECKMISPLKPILRNNVDLRYMNIIKRKPSIPKEDLSNLFNDF